MPHLSLSDFLDVVSKSGSPKATKVREIKHREPYNPATDYYKALREGLQELHKNAKSITALQAIMLKVSDPKKQPNYKAAIDGYSKWWGKKVFTWFEPPGALYVKNGFNLSVNPELGLEFSGQRHVIKLYLKAEPLSKFRTDLIVGLMGHVLGAAAPQGASMSVLDTRRSKLMSASAASNTIMATVDAEIAYIAALWPNV